MSRLTAVTVVALLLLAFCSGCRAFRAELGVGVGFGAELKLPYALHTGFGMQKFKYLGLNYDEGLRVGREDGYWEFSGSMILMHQEELHDRLVTLEKVVPGSSYDELHYRYAKKGKHLCPAVAPYFFDKHDHSPSTPFEIRLHALFFSIRLGFDPTKVKPETKEAEETPVEEGSELPADESPGADGR